MARVDVRMRIQVAWWVRPYLGLRRALANLTGNVPDLDAIGRHIGLGIRVKVER